MSSNPSSPQAEWSPPRWSPQVEAEWSPQAEAGWSPLGEKSVRRPSWGDLSPSGLGSGLPTWPPGSSPTHTWALSPPEVSSSGTQVSGKLFIISCHGVTFPDPTGKPAKMDVNVDTFTTAKFGCPVGTYIVNTKNYSLFAEPHTYFIPKILDGIRTSPSQPPDKDALRDIITSSLCDTRDNVGVFVPGTCKFMCHELGTQMADISIMGPGSYMVEAVLSVDLNTGDRKDVHADFGLEIDKSPLITHPTSTQITGLEHVAFDRESYDLSFLMGKGDREEEYRRRSERLAELKESLRGTVKSSRYRYHRDYNHKYVTVTYPNGYSYQMIKLSDVIQIAIEKGIIKPETDFVIAQACRTFDGQLPPDYAGSKSPYRDESGPMAKRTRSAGGRKRTRRTSSTHYAVLKPTPRKGGVRGTLGSLLTKNINNRNRNNRTKNNTKKRKRKTKTIRRT